jgi:hypothetical protein
LLFQKFLLAGNVAPVALGEHVLAQALDGLPGDTLRRRRLHGNLEHLARKDVLDFSAIPRRGRTPVPEDDDVKASPYVAV